MHLENREHHEADDIPESSGGDFKEVYGMEEGETESVTGDYQLIMRGSDLSTDMMGSFLKC